MRVAFEYGISASEISGVVRRTYIEALEARLQKQQRPTTDGRLAIVAGLTKSEVAALREALRTGAPHSTKSGASLDQITNLLTVWHTHSSFSGAYGLALDLDLEPIVGSPRKSFRELVETACPGVDPEALLDELAAAGSLEIVGKTTVRCLSRAYVPRGAEVAWIDRMSRFLGILTENFVHNLLRTESEPAYFERAVVSDYPLSEQGRDQFLNVAGEKGQELLEELDTFLTNIAAAETSASGKRYGVGLYFFEEPSGGQPGAQDAPRLNDGGNKKPFEEIDVLAVAQRKN